MFMDYEDILYDEKNGVATITINRPKVYNAFRPRTCVELIDAFLKAGWSEEIGAIVLTGAGNKAFCTGGDQSDHDGSYGDGETRGTIGLRSEEHTSELQSLMRISYAVFGLKNKKKNNKT